LASCLPTHHFSLQGTFIAAIQSQVMSTTIGMTHPSRAVQVVNILYLGGLVLDLMAAFLAFLTARWLQVLVEEERALLEEAFDERTAAKIASRGMLPKTNQTANSPTVGGPTTIKHHDNSNFYIKFMAFSLFSSFIILVLGASALLAGIIVFAWALQPKVVASLVSLVFVATLPFLIGVFLIGDEWERRSAVITRLSWIRGNW
jgi:magnesium-transporting ATPase (P-type)